MVLFLAIGDSHIPRRAKNIPDEIIDKLNELTKKERYEYTFFTGDLIKCPEFLDFLTLKTKRKVFRVIGNMDYFNGYRDAPIYQKLDIILLNDNELTIGLTHGAQIKPRGDRSQLESLAIEKKYHILISGHTHKEEIFLTKKGILLLNPGSITGAWSFVASGIPSFITLNIDEQTKDIDVTLFQLNKLSKEINEIKSYFKFVSNKIHYKF